METMTVNQYLAHPDRRQVKRIVLHGLDVLEHCFQGREGKENTIYGSLPDDDDRRRLAYFQEEVAKPLPAPSGYLAEIDQFADLGKRWERLDSDHGEIDVDRYIDRHDRPFDEYRRIKRRKPALDIVMDMGIPWSERGTPQMAERHAKIYQLALAAEAESQPCRIMAVVSLWCSPEQGDIELILILKDYHEPIFPSLWGGLKDSTTGNDFLNVVVDYLIGTASVSNGTLRQFTLSREKDFAGGEVVAIKPQRVILQD